MCVWLKGSSSSLNSSRLHHYMLVLYVRSRAWCEVVQRLCQHRVCHGYVHLCVWMVLCLSGCWNMCVGGKVSHIEATLWQVECWIMYPFKSNSTDISGLFHHPAESTLQRICLQTEGPSLKGTRCLKARTYLFAMGNIQCTQAQTCLDRLVTHQADQK